MVLLMEMQCSLRRTKCISTGLYSQHGLARLWTMLWSTGMLLASWFGVSQDGDLGLTDVTSTYNKQKQNIQNPKNINPYSRVV
jgi:hypothetical protein